MLKFSPDSGRKPRRPKLEAVGLDADDTLWRNEKFFRIAHELFASLPGDCAEPDDPGQKLLDVEISNLKLHGFGAKSFTLSMIESALAVADDRVPATIAQKILEAGKEWMSYPAELIPGAREAIEKLAGSVRLPLLTKGDLFDQERKLAQSGLRE